MSYSNNIFAYIFDSGRIESSSYGEAVFENMLKDKELSKNPAKIIVSLGDIFLGKSYIDIEPYIIKDEYCTIDFDSLITEQQFQDFPFCWIVEDLSVDIAQAIDKRLKKSMQGYIGQSRIDTTNGFERKQFWKNMIRMFSIFEETIICFQNPELSGPFVYGETATKLGYKVEYSESAEYSPIEECEALQSSQIKADENLKIRPQKGKDVDRDLFTLNFSIRDELQISGALIWKSVNALDKICFSESYISSGHLIEYPFLTLYHASQGVERIQKAIIELVCKRDHIKESEKEGIYNLLMSHAHEGLNNWIESKEGISFNSNCKKLIGILTRFYGTVRYARYSDEGCTRATTPEYDLLMELKSKNCADVDSNIKNNFGNYLGQLTNTYFKVFTQLCSALNINAYELECDSAALIVYSHQENPQNLYKELTRRQNAKKELFYWLMKKAPDYPKYSLSSDDALKDALDFDAELMEHYLCDLIFNAEDGQDYFDEVDCLYDELCSQDREKWKKRIELINYLIDRHNT